MEEIINLPDEKEKKIFIWNSSINPYRGDLVHSWTPYDVEDQIILKQNYDIFKKDEKEKEEKIFLLTNENYYINFTTFHQFHSEIKSRLRPIKHEGIKKIKKIKRLERFYRENNILSVQLKSRQNQSQSIIKNVSQKNNNNNFEFNYFDFLSLNKDYFFSNNTKLEKEKEVNKKNNDNYIERDNNFNNDIDLSNNLIELNFDLIDNIEIKLNLPYEFLNDEDKDIKNFIAEFKKLNFDNFKKELIKELEKLSIKANRKLSFEYYKKKIMKILKGKEFFFEFMKLYNIEGYLYKNILSFLTSMEFIQNQFKNFRYLYIALFSSFKYCAEYNEIPDGVDIENNKIKENKEFYVYSIMKNFNSNSNSNNRKETDANISFTTYNSYYANDDVLNLDTNTNSELDLNNNINNIGLINDNNNINTNSFKKTNNNINNSDSGKKVALKENFNFLILQEFLFTSRNKENILELIDKNDTHNVYTFMEILIPQFILDHEKENILFMENFSNYPIEKEIIIKNNSLLYFLEENNYQNFPNIKIRKYALLSFSLRSFINFSNFSFYKKPTENINLSNSNYFIEEKNEIFFRKFFTKEEKNLKNLNLSYNKLGKNLREFFMLKEIFINNSSLQILNISNNNINDNIENLICIYEIVKTCKSLKELYLGGNNLGLNSENFKILKEILIQENSLEYLDLSDNKINSNKENLLNLKDGLIENFKLKELNLNKNEIGSSSENLRIIQEIFMENFTLKFLSLNYNNLACCTQNFVYLKDIIIEAKSLEKISLLKNCFTKDIENEFNSINNLLETVKVII
jgi:hypothetical protein